MSGLQSGLHAGSISLIYLLQNSVVDYCLRLKICHYYLIVTQEFIVGVSCINISYAVFVRVAVSTYPGINFELITVNYCSCLQYFDIRFSLGRPFRDWPNFQEPCKICWLN